MGRSKEVAPGNFYARCGKRLLDLALAGPALVALSPLLALLVVLVRLRLGSPVLFRQERPGLHGQPFTIYKFRTMTDERDADGRLLPDSCRLTPLGRFLRKTSIDELPELYNVLKGEMSLVGPRPLLMAYLDRYTAEQMQRHQVLPGMTGWSQINGRQGIPFSKRLELDCWYAKHQSLGLDLRILLLTIPRVLQSRGVVLGQDVREVDDLNLHRSASASMIDKGEKDVPQH
jgi:sugar transferase EpsL